MSYHSLNDDSGGTSDDRRAEAWRIIEIFKECNALGLLTKNELDFVNKMAQGFPVSVNQLFWLRSIKERYCE